MSDEQLRVDIGRIIDVFAYDLPSKEGMDRLNLANEAIQQIHQAYKEAGYVQIPQVTEIRNTDPDTEWQFGLSDKKLTVNGKKVMTGDEWYQRFEAQYHMSADWIAGDETMGEDAEHDILNAAKRASGLDSDTIT